jgi:hypothetical protein
MPAMTKQEKFYRKNYMPPYYCMRSIKKMKKKRTLFLTLWIKQSGNLGEKDFSILPRLLGKTAPG